MEAELLKKQSFSAVDFNFCCALKSPEEFKKYLQMD
jgi:hypothetical protein